MRIGLLAPSRRYEDSFLHPSEALFRSSGDNLGNFAFVEALWRHLAPHATILPWHVSRHEARETCDLLVLAAANQLGAHNDLGPFAAHLEAIGLPIVAVGLGAQAVDMDAPVVLNAGTQRFARALGSLAPNSRPNIGVRGEFSRRVLEQLGLGDRVEVVGCPSNFLNDHPDFYGALKRRVDRGPIERLCVAAGSRHFAPALDLERRLVSFLSETGGLYVAQADLGMVAWARGEADDQPETEAIREFLFPGQTGESFRLWRRRHAVCFTDATSWLEAMRGCDFAVGARIHGVMLAIQAGTPGGVIAHDSRMLELCRTMDVPVRWAGETPREFKLADLPSMFPFDVAAYAATREGLRGVYVELLRGAGVEPNARLTARQAAA